MILSLALVIGIFLAFANGSNDNFKGVSTLYGSGTTSYKTALYWGTIATLLGSFAALIISKGLIVNFSGKGLVADAALADPAFLLSVGVAAAITVQLATRLGFPISTTHALTGALVGTGILASTSGINSEKLGTTFFLPLLLSPIIAIVGAVIAYRVFHFVRIRMGLSMESCVCINTNNLVPVRTPIIDSSGAAIMSASVAPSFMMGTQASCEPIKKSGVFGISPLKGIDHMHFLSAGVVSFARGLNDTPKLAAILLVTNAIVPNYSLMIVAFAIAVGGLLKSKRVAETISHRVTAMTPDQGFTGNIVTSVIVVLASKFGLPVSTTHVSCGALFGIGAVTGQAKWKMIAVILLAWVTTLPIAAALGATSFTIIKFLGGI